MNRVSAISWTMDRRTVASQIDHTLLKPEARSAAIRTLCREALEFHFAAVCVNPCWVHLAAAELAGSSVKLATVIGFPLGANETAVKSYEADRAMAAGAQELDMVLNVGELKDGNLGIVATDIAEVVRVAHASNARVKVILETALLSDEEKRAACRLAQQAGADFVKTSTGFGPGGATVADVQLMREAVGPTMGVKASGGIRTWDDCRAMMAAGASRIGTSAGVAIVQAIS